MRRVLNIYMEKIIPQSYSIEDYAEAIIPVINLCLKEKKENLKLYKKSHLWYLYRQAFYGFGDFMDGQSAYRMSAGAAEEYKKIDPVGDLRMRKWSEQPTFDSGRQKGIFHLEHVYTGDMFRDAVEALAEDGLTAQKLVQLIEKNYCVAWILKTENTHLPMSKRGKTLEDALAVYAEKGVQLSDPLK